MEKESIIKCVDYLWLGTYNRKGKYKEGIIEGFKEGSFPWTMDKIKVMRL